MPEFLKEHDCGRTSATRYEENLNPTAKKSERGEKKEPVWVSS